MMYYGGTGGGAGWLGMALMGFSMIAFWAVVISLVIWAMRSFGRPSTTSTPSAALGILQERFARGEITKEEYTHSSQVIRGTVT